MTCTKNLRPRFTSNFAKCYRVLAWSSLCLLVPLNAWAFVVYERESAEVNRIAKEITRGCGNSHEKLEALLRYMAFDVPAENNHSYFLLPVFRVLRPTPLQIIQQGGDCSYKSRALNVMLRRRGISAERYGLHLPSGEGVHAVTLVHTKRGDYIVDVLFGIIFMHEDGSPITFDEMMHNHDLLVKTISREIANGNPKAAKYPLSRYIYSDVRTINLEQYRWTAAIRRVLISIFGKDAIDLFPRPKIMSEPALVVISGSALLECAIFAPLAAARISNRRRRSSVSVRTTAGCGT
ncbi:MAG TPA: hypothetical protein VKU82_08805, partial [Planctomycetaceae bacterium]|nr:hypothetical protein [Planctomycetaceae bacterium]